MAIFETNFENVETVADLQTLFDNVAIMYGGEMEILKAELGQTAHSGSRAVRMLGLHSVNNAFPDCLLPPCPFPEEPRLRLIKGAGTTPEFHMRAYLIFFENHNTTQIFEHHGYFYLRPEGYFTTWTEVANLSTIVQKTWWNGQPPGGGPPYSSYREPGPHIVSISKPYNFQPGRWYCIESAFYRNVNGWMKTWIDGILIIDSLADYGVMDTHFAPDVNQSQYGIITCRGDVDLAIDDIVDNDRYIGPSQMASLSLNSTPQGIPVIIDGEPVGLTPISKDLPLGQHQIVTPESIEK